MATKITKKVTPVKKVEVVKEVAPVIKAERVKLNFSHSNLKISPRKLRLLANDVKKLSPSDVVTKLKFVNSNASRLLLTVLKNAIANATVKKLLADSLKFEEIRVDEGSKIKRMDKSHGSRFARGVIMKRHSRLLIVLSGTIQS